MRRLTAMVLTLLLAFTSIAMGEGIQLEPYQETLTITQGLTSSPAVVYAEGESETDNINTRYNLDNLNIKWEPYWYVPDTQVQEKINLAIATGDLPDVLQVDSTQLMNLIRNEQVHDMTAVYEEYASDLLRSSLEYDNKAAFVPATYDGKLYGIPITNEGGYGESVPVMYVRQDWLDKLQLTPPTTLEELKTVAAAFVNDDPDGNGIKDTFAIGLNASLGQTTLTAIANAYGAHPRIYIKNSDGQLVYSSVQPEMKQALAYMQELYNMGAFNPEFATLDNSKVNEMLVAGKIGILFGVHSAAISPFLQNKSADPNFDVYIGPAPTLDGNPVKHTSAPFYSKWIVVNKNFAHPEAVIKSMNLQAKILWDEGSELWQSWVDANSAGGAYEGKNANQYLKPYPFGKPQGWLEAYHILSAWKESGNKENLSASGQVFAGIIEGGGPFGWAYEKTFLEAWRVINDYGDFQFSEYHGATTPSMISKGPTLDALESEAFVSIVMGAPIDDFDTFVAQWKQLGGDDILKEINP